MEQVKKGTTNNQLNCGVCKIDFNSNADYALHEFSKKHCDNLIRLAKQKPIVTKQKTKNESPPVEKEPPKINTVVHSGSFAKYGYFVPGETYVSCETSKEFNTDYDPYLQKYAEDPLKEKPSLQTYNEMSSFCPVTGFSKKKKIKIKTCQVCNITLLTVPEYEAHMKSPQHIWKLKVTGMGVSAHFVKASTDLHTTDINEESKPNYQVEEQAQNSVITGNENSPSGPFPLLYCNDCKLLLNSPQQYNAHISGKFHIENAQKVAELKAKKEKLENPSPNQLYCYSCKISLNNLFQFNEHKNGKKHKTKCKALVRKGITIPPEERVPGIPNPNPNKRIVYPDLYEKLILEKQKQKEPEVELNLQANGLGHSVFNNLELSQETISTTESVSYNDHIENNFENHAGLGFYNTSAEFSKKSESMEEIEMTSPFKKNLSEHTHEPKIIFHQSNMTSQVSVSEVPNTHLLKNESQEASTNEKEECDNKISIVTENTPINCNICNESFQWQNLLDKHLATEEHLKKILELKLNGTSENEILKTLFLDRNVIKPNNSGQLSCSICCVTTDSSIEFDQHLNSIVHKYTEKDYKKKRTLEVKHLIACNDKGQYYCKSCKEEWSSLVDFTQHLHTVKHKSIQRAQRARVFLAKRRTSHLQKQRLLQNLKKRNLIPRKVNLEKNSLVQTKVCGVANDSHPGTQEPVPNLKPPEPNIDVSIGASEKSDSSNVNNINKLKLPKMRRSRKGSRSNRKIQGGVVNRQNRGGRPYTPGNIIPPLIPSLPYPRYSRPNYISPNSNWAPFPSSCSRVFGPFCGRPSPNPYFRPTYFQRPPWSRYR